MVLLPPFVAALAVPIVTESRSEPHVHLGIVRRDLDENTYVVGYGKRNIDDEDAIFRGYSKRNINEQVAEKRQVKRSEVDEDVE